MIPVITIAGDKATVDVFDDGRIEWKRPGGEKEEMQCRDIEHGAAYARKIAQEGGPWV